MCKIGSFDFVLMWVVFDMFVGMFYIGFRILGFSNFAICIIGYIWLVGL
jgi:hypothetical protein